MHTVKYIIEVNEELNKRLNEVAKIKGMPVEKYVSELVNRYALSLHTMDQEALGKGYEETGDINLDWANLK